MKSIVAPNPVPLRHPQCGAGRGTGYIPGGVGPLALPAGRSPARRAQPFRFRASGR